MYSSRTCNLIAPNRYTGNIPSDLAQLKSLQRKKDRASVVLSGKVALGLECQDWLFVLVQVSIQERFNDRGASASMI